MMERVVIYFFCKNSDRNVNGKNDVTPKSWTDY